jgi:hypothetical protein
MDRVADRVKGAVAGPSVLTVESAEGAGNTCVSISDKGVSRGIQLRTLYDIYCLML